MTALNNSEASHSSMGENVHPLFTESLRRKFKWGARAVTGSALLYHAINEFNNYSQGKETNEGVLIFFLAIALYSFLGNTLSKHGVNDTIYDSVIDVPDVHWE